MKKVIFLSSVVLICVVAFAQFEHPDLKSGKKQIRSVVIMPVQAEINRVSMKGPEPMVEESRRVEKDLTPVIAEVMKNLGCKVKDTAATPEELASDPELKYVIDDLQKQFDASMEQMVKKSKDVRKGRFTLGDTVTKLPAGENADALVFVRAAGQVLTGGKKAFGLLIGGPAFDMVQIHLGVVDAKNGDILYFAKPFLLKNLAKDPADARDGIVKSFKNFAKANQLGLVAADNSGASTASSVRATASAIEAKSSNAENKADAPSAPASNVDEVIAARSPSDLTTTKPPLEASSTAIPLTSATPNVKEIPSSSLAASGPKVYVFVLRTENHVKRSDADVFEKAMHGLADYLKAKNIAVASDTSGTLNHADYTISMDRVLEAARYSKAASVLYVSVDRPTTKWIEFKVQCLDMNGKEFWTAKAGSGGGFSGGHGLRVGLEHLQAELDKHVGQPGLPVATLTPSPTSQGK
jgi:hypothetical protein